ncbi:PLP-dependent transferase [bacterium]|nr:PLP-dependent transferase [bacterium]
MTQMRGYGGRVFNLVKSADWKETTRIIDATKIPRIAPGLGGVESLSSQSMVMSNYHRKAEKRHLFGIADNMNRMSFGTENTYDLIADLRQALLP